jgi:hypothetical protein
VAANGNVSIELLEHAAASPPINLGAAVQDGDTALGDSVSIFISKLPRLGRLYNVLADGSLGAEITRAWTPAATAPSAKGALGASASLTQYANRLFRVPLTNSTWRPTPLLSSTDNGVFSTIWSPDYQASYVLGSPDCASLNSYSNGDQSVRCDGKSWAAKLKNGPAYEYVAVEYDRAVFAGWDDVGLPPLRGCNIFESVGAGCTKRVQVWEEDQMSGLYSPPAYTVGAGGTAPAPRGPGLGRWVDVYGGSDPPPPSSIIRAYAPTFCPQPFLTRALKVVGVPSLALACFASCLIACLPALLCCSPVPG